MRRTGKLHRRMTIAAVTAGVVFQVSSCSIDQSGVINAFADPAALSGLRTQLFEASPLGQLLNSIDGSVDVHIGNDE